MQEQLHNWETIVTLVACQCQGALLELVGVGVDASSRVKQQPGNSDAPGAGRLHQWCVTILIVLFNIGTCLDQRLHCTLVSIASSVMKCGVT